MTTDRALELAESLLHEERTFPNHLHPGEAEDALQILAKMRRVPGSIELLLSLVRR